MQEGMLNNKIGKQKGNSNQTPIAFNNYNEANLYDWKYRTKFLEDNRVE